MAPLLNIALLLHETVTAFTGSGTAIAGPGHCCCCHRGQSVAWSSKDDDRDWDIGNAGEDPRLDAMRSMLESSWDGEIMGPVPISPEEGAEAASKAIAEAMGAGENVVMVDIRLPSYDVMEGPKLYDQVGVYDFCSCLSDNLREKKLIRKSLVLVRSEKERAVIDRARSRRYGQEKTTDGGEMLGKTAEIEARGKVDDFRQQLMSSWEPISNEEAGTQPPASEEKISENDNDNSSHRLWSMIGTEELSHGPDMFNQVIAAVDKNALLKINEDALIILAPHGPVDTVGVRRIMARYGQTRTIIFVNSRIEQLPIELAPALLVYGMLPLIARSPGDDNGEAAGLKAVVMKRFPADWVVYVDVGQGEGFVEVMGSSQGTDGTDKVFPSPEWIARRVQAHVEGLPRQQ